MALVTLVGGIVLFVLRWTAPRPVGFSQEQLDVAVESLARVQAEQWGQEETARQIRDPWPLPVRWKVTARAEAVRWRTGRPLSAPRRRAPSPWMERTNRSPMSSPRQPHHVD